MLYVCVFPFSTRKWWKKKFFFLLYLRLCKMQPSVKNNCTKFNWISCLKILETFSFMQYLFFNVGALFSVVIFNWLSVVKSVFNHRTFNWDKTNTLKFHEKHNALSKRFLFLLTISPCLSYLKALYHFLKFHDVNAQFMDK